ncbi:MAG: neutral/alkaline non-lysosomal ceramidase N-terminal domain-containing protein [Deltaproteobacteria bacterium]|nr:neutral/alkaline non-lysosomal ceramidase N-terminal domain-containing protein [Deltaproteobacteria bacterium]
MRGFGATLLTFALTIGCETLQVPHAHVAPTRGLGAGFLAGVARADITPPPGLSLYGYGPEARIAVGWRTRLHCNVFVLSQSGAPIAIAVCDIAAPSSELHSAVAQRLRERGLPIGGERLFIMATHTHGGPAHYFAERGYSGPFSSRLFGYDPRVRDWIADRMAGAIVEAYSDVAPAKARWARAEIRGLTRNRSLDALLSNRQPTGKGLPELIERRLALARAEASSLERRSIPTSELAVDPSLTVLRIDREGSSLPIGVLAVFSMHPTGLGPRNEFYHSDIFGSATRTAQAELVRRFREACASIDRDPSDRVGCESRQSVVVGLANGSLGDVSPNVTEQTSREVRRIGHVLAMEIVGAVEKAARAAAAVDLTVAYRDLDLPRGLVSSVSRSRRLAAVPEVGVASAGGPEDGPTSLRFIPAFNEGVRVADNPHEHGRKWILSAPGRTSGENEFSFPERAPIGLIRLGGWALVTVPGEATTVLGWDLKTTVASGLGVPTSSVALVSLVNSSIRYLTTAAEYDEQSYEGASTLYGRNSAEFFETHFGCLAEWMRLGSSPAWTLRCELEQTRAVNTWEAVPSDPRPIVDLLPQFVAGGEDIFNETIAVREIDFEGDRAFEVRWLGLGPGMARSRHQLSVGVRDVEAAGPCGGERSSCDLIDDDSSGNLLVRYVRALGWSDVHEWSAIWVPGQAVSARKCQFVIHGHEILPSREFDCGSLGVGVSVARN